MSIKERMTRLMADHCDQPFEKVMEDTERDRFLTAPDAVDYGLVDRIVQTRDEEMSVSSSGETDQSESGSGGDTDSTS